jgi:phosphoglycerate dehydrogenase-like enzyme
MGDTQGSGLALITAPFEEAWLERVRHIAPESSIVWHPHPVSDPIPDELWARVEILFTSFGTPLPAPSRVPRLRWVQLYSAGVDSVAEHPLFATEVVFTTTSGVHAICMGEFVLAVMLAWFHRLPAVFAWQRRAAWPDRGERVAHFGQDEAHGKTIGIVGYGSIGRHVARLASTFGMRVLAMQRGEDHADQGCSFPDVGDTEGRLPARYYAPGELHQMLAECDVVVIAAPLTPATRGLFDDAVFAAMRLGALLINCARGAICDEAALVRALERGRIAGAALDVFAAEPLPPDHPLWRLPNVILSPHISGLSARYAERAARIFEENLRRYRAGELLVNLVDKARGY